MLVEIETNIWSLGMPNNRIFLTIRQNMIELE
jgi:hypothetical protein